VDDLASRAGPDHLRGTAPRPWQLAWAAGRAEVLLAVAAFAVLCLAVLRVHPALVEPDDFAYRASIVGITDGHLLTLSSAQVNALTSQLARQPGNALTLGPGQPPPQWVELAGGRWISEKDPGYPFLAAPFQLLGVIRLAPLFYGALACAGLFAGARRWLGRFGGAAAVGLFCSSGAALLFAWRDYMPTFTDASLIAAGTGALLWAVLATEATARRRTWTGLAGFVALEAAVFARYTDIVVLGCAVLAVLVAWRLRRVPGAALGWWLGSVAVFGAGVAAFDDLVYGGPGKTGYRPGEITFSLSAVAPNLRLMPAHLIEAIPMLVLGLAALVGILVRWLRLRRADSAPAAGARRDLAVGLALAACWSGVWGLYAAYTWTALPGLTTLQAVRFYVPALGAIALLGAWLVVRVPPRPALAGVATAAVLTVVFVLGIWSFSTMTSWSGRFLGPGPGPHGVVHGVVRGPGPGVRISRP
jgi:hypothetical protein